MNINFDKNIREDLKEAIDRCLHKYKVLIPDWLRELNIYLWESPEDGETINVVTLHEYRSSSLNFTCGWMNLTDRERELAVIHELLHIHLEPITEFARKTYDRLLEEDAPKFHDTVREEHRARVEGVVQDMAYMFYNMLDYPRLVPPMNSDMLLEYARRGGGAQLVPVTDSIDKAA